MHRKQRGFLIALCLCILSLSGIFGIYQYRRGQAQDVPKQTADRLAEEQASKEDAEREAGNRLIGQETIKKHPYPDIRCRDKSD